MFFNCIWIKFPSTLWARYSLSIISHHFLSLILWNCIWVSLHCSLFVNTQSSFVSKKIWVLVLFLWWLMTSFYWWMLHFWSCSMPKCSSFIFHTVKRSSLTNIVTILLWSIILAVLYLIFSIVTQLSSGNMRRSFSWFIRRLVIFEIGSTIFCVISTLWKIISAEIWFKCLPIIIIFWCWSISRKNWCIHSIYVWII